MEYTNSVKHVKREINMSLEKAFQQVIEFHEHYGVPVVTVPSFPPVERRNLRKSLEVEELQELHEADANNDLAGVADAAADLIYVILGRCAEYGIPISTIFTEVHYSNMTKLGDDGKPVRRDDGKVIKGPNWQAPRIREILEAAGRIK
jgi:predicted HAD superfamily Cof-like phosphohydrolase